MTSNVRVGGPTHKAGFCNACNVPHPMGVFVVMLRNLEFRLCPNCRDEVVAGLGVGRDALRQPPARCRTMVEDRERIWGPRDGPAGPPPRRCKRRATISCFCTQHARLSGSLRWAP